MRTNMAKQNNRLKKPCYFFDEMQEKIQIENIKRRKLMKKPTCSQPEQSFLQFDPKNGKNGLCSFSSKFYSQPSGNNTNKTNWRPPTKVFTEPKSLKVNEKYARGNQESIQGNLAHELSAKPPNQTATVQEENAVLAQAVCDNNMVERNKLQINLTTEDPVLENDKAYPLKRFSQTSHFDEETQLVMQANEGTDRGSIHPVFPIFLTADKNSSQAVSNDNIDATKIVCLNEALADTSHFDKECLMEGNNGNMSGEYLKEKISPFKSPSNLSKQTQKFLVDSFSNFTCENDSEKQCRVLPTNSVNEENEDGGESSVLKTCQLISFSDQHECEGENHDIVSCKVDTLPCDSKNSISSFEEILTKKTLKVIKINSTEKLKTDNLEDYKSDCELNEEIINLVDTVLSEDECDNNVQENNENEGCMLLIDSVLENSSSSEEVCEEPNVGIFSMKRDKQSLQSSREKCENKCTKRVFVIPEINELKNDKSNFFEEKVVIEEAMEEASNSQSKSVLHEEPENNIDGIHKANICNTGEDEGKIHGDDEYSCLMISDSQLLEIEKKYYEEPHSVGMCNKPEIVTPTSDVLDRIECDKYRKTSVGTQTEVQICSPIPGLNHKNILPNHPEVQWPKKIQETQRKLRDIIQEIGRLNAILNKIRQEVWPQQNIAENGSGIHRRTSNFWPKK